MIPMAPAGENIGQMAADRHGRLGHGLEPVAGRPPEPGGDESLGGLKVPVPPELLDVLLGKPGPGRLEVAVPGGRRARCRPLSSTSTPTTVQGAGRPKNIRFNFMPRLAVILLPEIDRGRVLEDCMSTRCLEEG